MISRTSLFFSAAALLAMTACAPPNPNSYAGDPTARTRNGAITGALIGGALGASQEEDSLAKAAIGAIVGGAIGGAIGDQLDKQAAELRAVNSAFTVTNMGDYLIVNLPQDVLFATDSATLRPALTRDLQAVGANLNSYPNSTIQVIGHTDNVGEAAYNQDLSERRALSVAGVLRASGVPAGRVQAFGKGEDQPAASNLTAEGRAQNRRVEIIIRPTR
jgi:outer membrane protein OmpA-like peptidoglycan-associated protein